jgi:hypothetical protein
MVNGTSDDRELICQHSPSKEALMTSTRPLRPRTGSPRPLRFLLTLALLPAAGVTLAGVGIASASDDAPKPAVTHAAAVARHPEPGDDRGTDVRAGRPTPHPTNSPSTPAPRAPEVGDDSGGHGGRSAATATTTARTSRPVTTRAAEPGDDSAGHHSQAQSRTRTRSRDDAVRHSTSSARPSATRAPEAGDDSGGHGGRTTATRAPEAGDDSGGHGGRTSSGSGGSGRHGGSDDGAGHS